MAVPKVFISSTYIDLKDIRGQLSDFIKDYGLNPTLFEKDDITFFPDNPLDESCYKEVKNSDVYVLIIGGRYGSPASNEETVPTSVFKQFNSVTRKEYYSAVDLGIPIHIFIESDVLSEFYTYKRNKSNKNIKYAHVDDTQIFHLIEEIYNQEKNNYIKRFSSCDEITHYLQLQWAGMFKEYIDNLKAKKKQGTAKSRINSFKLFFLEIKKITFLLKIYLREQELNTPS